MSCFSNWSHSVRRAFVKDYAIPVSVVQDPYFEHQIDFLDKQYQTWEKVDLLNDALSKFKNEDEFFNHIHKTRESIINSIKEHAHYETLGTKDINLFDDKEFEKKIPEKCVYKMENVGSRMVSVDLVSANFQAFKIFFPTLVNEKNTYEEFVSQFTDLEYFKKSKKIRQVIFGNLNPKKQMIITKHIMFLIYHILNRESHLNIRMISSDEIVFRECDHLKQKPISVIEGIVSGIQLEKKQVSARVKEFTIEPVKMKTSSAYIKRFPDGSFDLKCCPGPYTIEVLRHIYGQSVHSYDKVFYNDGRICEYKDSLFD